MISRMTEAVRNVLNRKAAYRRVFMNPQGDLTRDGEIVLADLRRFCRASSSTAIVSPVSKQIDPLAMAMAEGRREVFNRLVAHLFINEKQVFNLTDEDKL